jgi:hypothetical protein
MGVLHFIRFFGGVLFYFIFFFFLGVFFFSFLLPPPSPSASPAGRGPYRFPFCGSRQNTKFSRRSNLALHLAPNREIHGEITNSVWMRLDKKKKEKLGS